MANGLEDFLHRRALPDDAEIVIFLLQQRLVSHHLLHRPRRRERARHELLQLWHVERFQHVIIRAVLHRLDRRLRRTEGGHDDHRRLRVKLPQPLQRLDAADAAHAHVHDHEVRAQLRDHLQRLLATPCRVQLQPILPAKDALKRIPHIRLVID